ncbi:MAG: FprA family A-type flavoprotein [Coriobacteriia bacterium]|nr:FprA family A-type flavoprotein [Coriobacteriia bacterium]
MRAIKVTENIWWVGAIDWSLRDFHGFETPLGTTYSCYLVMGDDGIALIDATKAPFVSELLERVRSVVPLEKITHIVVNHVEPDHNGGLPEVMAAMPQARVVASPAGVKGVAEYHNGLVVEAVKAGDEIDLGGRTLRFLPMSMVHWPDSMFTYCPEERVLMPNDAFGQHVSSDERFASDYGLSDALHELGVYYANILLPLGTAVGKAIDKVLETGWEIDVVAPAHGLIWRGEEVGQIIEEYRRWGTGEKRDKAVIVYSTMWGSTAALATRIADAMAAVGVEVGVYDLAVTPIAHITAELLEAKALVLGSPTLHHGMLYRMAGYLQYLAGLKPTDRIAGVFSSYGWSKGAEKQMTARLEEIGFELPIEPYMVKYRPTDEDFEAVSEWAVTFAEAVKAL